LSNDNETALEAFTEFLAAVDAGVCAARETIKKAKGISIGKSGTWHPNGVEWQNANGQKGPYQKSVDYENPQHQTMLQDLLDHDGKLRRENYFYWVFSDNKTIGRKQK